MPEWRIHRYIWFCSSCGTGPYLAPLNDGDLDGYRHCATCGNPFDSSDKKEIGPEITDPKGLAAAASGKHKVCGSCEVANPVYDDGTDVTHCGSCGDMLPEGIIEPEGIPHSLSNQLSQHRPEVEESTDAVVEWLREEPTLPEETRDISFALPKVEKSFFTRKSVIAYAIAAVVIGLIAWLIIFLTTPQPEHLTMIRGDWNQCTHYTWVERHSGECWEGDCPTNRVTQTGSEIQTYYSGEEVVVSTAVATSVSERTVTEYGEPGPEEQCGEPVDLENGAVAIPYCTATPAATEYVVTEVATHVTEVVGTATPYDRNRIFYVQDSDEFGSVCTGTQNSYSYDALYWPEIPGSVSYSDEKLGNQSAVTTFSHNSGVYTVYFENEKGKIREMHFNENEIDQWLAFYIGEEFPSAQVLPGGTIVSLYPEE